MSPDPARQTLQQRVSAAILDGAARAFVVAGEQASMSQVAEAAGVARATVYRYFPNRDALLDELTREALAEVDRRLTSARIDEVDPEEGISRLIRVLVEIGDSFVLLARERARSNPEQYERSLLVPMRRLFARAQATGEIRSDVADGRLSESVIGLVTGLLTSPAPPGNEDLIAMLTTLLLDGARARGPQRR